MLKIHTFTASSPRPPISKGSHYLPFISGFQNFKWSIWKSDRWHWLYPKSTHRLYKRPLYYFRHRIQKIIWVHSLPDSHSSQQPCAVGIIPILLSSPFSEVLYAFCNLKLWFEVFKSWALYTICIFEFQYSFIFVCHFIITCKTKTIQFWLHLPDLCRSTRYQECWVPPNYEEPVCSKHPAGKANCISSNTSISKEHKKNSLKFFCTQQSPCCKDYSSDHLPQ